MTDIAAQRIALLRYRDVFVFALLAVSTAPLIISMLNFEVTSATVYVVTALWSVLLLLNGAHVWITLAYYCDLRWLMLFLRRPVVFFLMPLSIFVFCTVIVTRGSILVGMTLVYSTDRDQCLAPFKAKLGRAVAGRAWSGR